MCLGEALGGISGEKIRGKKIVTKKVRKVLASARDADPGQDPPAGFFRKVRHAFAHPNGWAGGLFALRVTRRGHLEAWRLGGFEDWRGRYLDKNIGETGRLLLQLILMLSTVYGLLPL